MSSFHCNFTVYICSVHKASVADFWQESHITRMPTLPVVVYHCYVLFWKIMKVSNFAGLVSRGHSRSSSCDNSAKEIWAAFFLQTLWAESEWFWAAFPAASVQVNMNNVKPNILQWNLDLRKILKVTKIFLKLRFFLISNIRKSLKKHNFAKTNIWNTNIFNIVK